MKTQRVKLADLLDNPGNPRVRLTPDDPEYQTIRHGLDTYGLVEPILVTPDNRIIDGHQRAHVLADMGRKTVDVIVHDIDTDTASAVGIALNKIEGRWDDEALLDRLNTVPDALDAGFSPDAVAALADRIEQAHVGDFLDDLANEEVPDALDDEPDVDDEQIQFDGGEEFNRSDWSKLTYVVSTAERDLVIAGLRKAQEIYEQETLARALHAACVELLTVHGMADAILAEPEPT